MNSILEINKLTYTLPDVSVAAKQTQRTRSFAFPQNYINAQANDVIPILIYSINVLTTWVVKKCGVYYANSETVVMVLLNRFQTFVINRLFSPWRSSDGFIETTLAWSINEALRYTFDTWFI